MSGASVEVLHQLAHDVLSARRARDHVRRALRAWRLDGIGADAELLTSELVSNAVLHTPATSSARGDIQLRVVRIPAGLRVEVSDHSTVLPSVRPAGDGGRGLHLVDALADRWGSHIDGIGKVVWFELGLNDEHVAASVRVSAARTL